MVTTIEYALLAGASYRDTRAHLNRFPIPANWSVVSLVPQDPSTGFEASSYRNSLKNEIVISYAGTNPNDGILPPGPDNTANIGLAAGFGATQLLQAAEYFLQIQAANPTANITFTGHSLGGGLAALMGVFFGKRAVTFDQAPFANSVELNMLTPNVAANLKTDLLTRGYSDAALQGLTDFLNLRAATGGIPNSSLVDSINVEGEFLSGVPWNILDRIGIPVNIPNSAPGVSGFDLHSQALLTAFLQSIQTAVPQQTLHEVTFKLTDLLGMIVANSLYARSTGTANTTDENFLERLVRHETGVSDPITGATTTAADAMVTRFTRDLWKLAQDGGLTMADNPTAATNLVSKALTAFAMQMYYEDTANAVNANKELFTEVTGGVQFSRADVAATLDQAKGYNLYFQHYLNSDAFTGNESQLMQLLLPTLSDWYVQAGASGMDATAINNRGTFMLGGAGADTLTGGNQADLLVGNGGSDVLLGGAGQDILLGQQGNDVLEGGADGDILVGGLENDTLRGGSGLDRYLVRAIDGADTIEDSDGRGVVEFDGEVLLSGLRRTDDPANVFHSADGTITLTKQGNNDLVVTGSGPLTIKNFATGLFGIRLFGEAGYAAQTRDTFLKTVPDPNNPPPATIQVAFFDEGNNHSSDLEDPLTDGTNNLIHAQGGNDTIISGNGDDQFYGEGGSDELYGGLGNDRLYGGSEDDQLFGDNVAVSTSGGNDFIDGGEGNDLLQGGAGRDFVFGGAGNDNLNGDEFAGDNSGGFEDYLDAGAGDDELHGAAGNDVLIGGTGNDLLIGDTTQFQNGTPEQGGNDSLDGGEGQDQLFGLYGDDLLVGGIGNDLVNGQDGSDVLYGGEGNDTLSGDLRLADLAGGYDTREWRAAGGDDLLVGETGADLLSGGEGNDILEGGSENDQVYGDYITSQVSTSNPLYWTLFSALGDDQLSGGTGNDVLAGGFGADVLVGEEGTDSLFGGEGDDFIEGGAGDDVLYGEYLLTASEFLSNPFMTTIRALSGNDLLSGGGGNDDLHGGKGNDSLYGGDGVDTLDGGDGMDLAHGGAGNDRLTDFQGDDTLYGDEGDDFLSSGLEPLPSREGEEPIPATGDSTLIGGIGNDTYEIDSSGDVVVEAAGEGIDTVDSFASYTLPHAVENLTLRGLLLVGAGNDLDNILTGGNQLEGFGGADTLIGSGRLDGGTGNDVLQGTGGVPYFNEAGGQLQYLANTYAFAPGSGHDTIQENDAVFNSSYYHNEDTVAFAAGISPSDVAWERSGNDLLFTVSGGIDRIAIPSFYDLRFDRGGYLVNGVTVPPQGIVSTSSGFPTYVAPSRVEVIQFEDGTVWHADQYGTPLLGDFRADNYRFESGSGDISILDFDFSQSNIDRELDSVVLGTGLLPSDLMVSRVGDDLALSVNGTTDRLTIQSFFKTVIVTPPFSFSGYSVAAYRIEQVQFANGTVWTVSNLINRISTFTGTSEDDTLFGNQNDNLIRGLSGDDFLSGQDGDDVLDGGVGNDRLFGDAGNDTYVFGRGGGQDILASYDATGTETEVVRLGSDVLPSDVTIQVVGTSNDLVVRINGTNDQLLLDEFLWRSDYQIDRLEFGDGTVWDSAMILAHATGLTLTGTNTDNTLRGSVLGDVLTGLGGNDTLIGNAGDDQLIGGLGDDVLSGDEGDDTYVFNLGDGVDTIYDEVVPGEANRIVFGAGITPSDLTFTHDEGGQTLTIQLGSSGTGQLHLMDFDPTGADGSLVGSTLQFVGGSTLNLADLFPKNRPPTVATPLADQTVAEDTLFSIAVPSYTFTDWDASDVLTLSASLADGAALPSWLSFDATTRIFSGTPDDVQVGIFDVRVTATDIGNLAVSDQFTLTVTNVNEAPTVGAPLADQIAVEDAAFTFAVSASTFADVDKVHGDVLTYSATLQNGSELPTWLSFDPATRTFSGMPLNSDVDNLSIAVNARDSGGLSATNTFVLTVKNVNDAPTVANPLADQSAAEDSPFSFTIPGTTFGDADQIHGDQLTYSATRAGGSPLPTWLSFDPTGRILSGTPDAGDAGVLQIAATATDQQAVGVTDQFALTVSGPLPQSLTGTAGNDVLTGGRGNDTLKGLAGNDQLNGGEGNDLLDGGPGSDTMTGGIGDDAYIVDTPGDVVTEPANEGTDIVQSSITFTLGANVENLTLTGAAAITGTGNALNNVLLGNSANNTLTGGAGNDWLDGGLGSDTMVGGAGNDTYVVNQVGDVVAESLNQGTETVESSIAFTLSSNVENLTLTGTANIDGTGSSANNVLLGNSGSNTLDGGSGNDQADGGAGNDSLFGGSGDDALLGGMGDDTLNAGSGSDLLNGGDGTDTLDGGSGDDQLLGGAGNDTMTGGSGADEFTGDTGNDTMTGGSGNDIYNFARGDGQDTIIEADLFQGNQDRALFGVTINPRDLVITRQANDLRLSIHGSSDRITLQNWYLSTNNRIETIQAGNGQTLLSTQVDQLIQAMASFSQQSGLTWDQAIDQQPQAVQTVLAASWQ